MTVFADRNKIEKEETFELASAARDRFMFELSMYKPKQAEVRRSLAFDPLFHDADSLLELVAPAIVSSSELNVIGSAIQKSVHASEAIERYILDLWEATDNPMQFGIRVDGVDMAKLILAGASPRGMSALLRAARVVAWLSNRTHLVPDDVHAVLPSALGHRIFFTPLYELRRSEIAAALVEQIMQRVASP
jgi:MoxR-like ATPase